MGSQALAEGFALIGFEIFPNATAKLVETELSKLLKNQEKALVFLEDSLTQQPGPSLLRARTEAAGIILSEIPPLNAPENYQPMVEALVARILGPSVLD